MRARADAPRGGLFDRFLRSVGLARVGRPSGARSAYVGAHVNRLTADWVFAPISSANREVQESLLKLRAHSRELARNNGIVRRFLRMSAVNVIGPSGIRLQAQVKGADGTLDKATNDALEAGFREWSRRENASIDGRLSLHGLARLAVVTKRMDGEALIRIRRGASYNRFGFTLQILDADQLDDTYNVAPIGEQNEIRMGVEIDRAMKPVAYYVWSAHPTEYAQKRERVRIPAEDVIHLYGFDRPGQVRGVPDAHAVLADLKMRAGYQEAELVAARTAAAKMGFFTQKTEEGAFVDPNADPDADRLTLEAEPGLMTQLDPGWSFQSWDPEHPVAAFPAFMKAIDRSIATGLDMSYPTLMNDYESVNYSSGKLGLQPERDAWRLEQEYFVEHFYERVYREYVRMGLLTGALRLAIDAARYHAVTWQPRGWPSPDPLKEAQANAQLIAMGQATFGELCAESGGDFADNVEKLAEEYKLAAEKGVPIVLPTITPPAAADAKDDSPADAPTKKPDLAVA